MSFSETAEDVFAFLAASQRDGLGCALGVVTSVTGGSARSVGTLVGVRDDGEMAGYISHGCVDGDLKLQAIDAIADGRVRELVYGTGSPFIDLTLPCGGTVDVMLLPAPKATLVTRCEQFLSDRSEVSLVMSAAEGLISVEKGHLVTGWTGTTFKMSVQPRVHLCAAGTGPAFQAVAKLAAASDLGVHLVSPVATDKKLSDHIGALSFQHLRSSSEGLGLTLDSRTAVLTLFHDHAWEPNILADALASTAFYVGALGSAKTQIKRLKTLRELGVSQSSLDRLIGPIGVIASARDARTLALSALTQIMDHARR